MCLKLQQTESEKKIASGSAGYTLLATSFALFVTPPTQTHTQTHTNNHTPYYSSMKRYPC